MVSLDLFFPTVRGRLPGCPETVLRDAIRDACIEFCKRTQLFTQEVTVDVAAGEAQTVLYPDSDVLWEILDLRRDTSPLTALNRTEFLVQGYAVDAGTPAYYYLDGDRALVLGPVPDTAETLTALVTSRPTDTATYVADALWSDFREPVSAGARAWVRRHYGEWSEPRLEAEDRQFFERAIHNQNIRRARGGAGTALRVRAYGF